jgi:Bifunctional DNA primase/polymerase, N-terminal/Primase C terminal 1 (PriCT-1)
VGIVTGAVSSLVVVDVDPLHGGAGSLEALERAHGPLPETVRATTGGGGVHLYFAHPGGPVPNKVGLVAGIDLRGDGGFVVAPPSVHPSGRRYVWLRPDRPDEAVPAAMPGWLIQLVRERGYRPGHTLAHWRRLVEDGVQEGERNSSIASLAGHLFWRGIDPKVVLDLLLCWNARRCRPPLSEEEVARTVDSIMRLHQSDDTPAGVP